MGEHGGPLTTRPCCGASSGRLPRGLEDHPVRTPSIPRIREERAPDVFVRSALSEVVGSPLPYDDVLSLRDRMWEISPTLIRYDVTEPTSTEVALTGLKAMVAGISSTKVTGTPFKKPIENFYQTDPISRA